jgi:hypothetical protein
MTLLVSIGQLSKMVPFETWLDWCLRTKLVYF